MGFDFLIWLVDQEMTRIREGAPAPLKVGFWRGAAELNPEGVLWVNRVYRPVMDLFGAVEDERAIHGRQKDLYVPRDIVKASRAAEPVPRIKANPLFDGAVTITLREADYYPQRNSRVSEWYRFALVLQGRGERVIFVRDTCKAYEPIIGFETCPIASLDLGVRASMYVGAKMNFFASNGPAALAIYSNSPYTIFIPRVDGYVPGTAQFWKDSSDITPPEQWPWAAGNQKMIWENDTYENILAAWESLKL